MSDQAFAFRPWVRSTCRRAMIWGVGAVAALGGLAWWFRTPGSAPLGRAFGALVFYGLLFLLSLAKIWWTAGRPAVVLDDETVGYQPLHTFSPRRVAFTRILACGPRQGSQSLRIVHVTRRQRVKELFINLAVVKGRHALLRRLGERLRAHGLEEVPGEPHSWRRPEAELG